MYGSVKQNSIISEWLLLIEELLNPLDRRPLIQSPQLAFPHITALESLQHKHGYLYKHIKIRACQVSLTTDAMETRSNVTMPY